VWWNLAITGQAAPMLCGWEGNRRSGIALATCIKLCGPHSEKALWNAVSYNDPVVLSHTTICLSVCPMAQLPQAIDTLAACSLAMSGRRTRPLTDVDPLRVELPSAGDISSRRPRGDILLCPRERDMDMEI